MPVEVVGRPSKGDGRTPGMMVGGGAEGDFGEAGEEEGPTRPTFRLRKDIACWRVVSVCKAKRKRSAKDTEKRAIDSA